MKKLFLTFVFAFVATLAAMAQQISVVSSSGTTTLYQTLEDAIEGANPGSVIYLPGGSFPISDDVKITKKLTIIGIGHKSNNENVDCSTIISNNLFFSENCSGSALMGCYIIGNVNISNGQDDIAIKFCNINELIINDCNRTFVNQNYIRYRIAGAGTNATITNNIISHCRWLSNAKINYNIISSGFWDCHNDIIKNNVIKGSVGECSNNFFENNLENVDFSSVFTSNYHFTETFANYESQVGIYAGDGFNDQQIAPVPYIVAKRVDEQTDASGKLNVKIRVKAGQ